MKSRKKTQARKENFLFKINAQSAKSRARRGVISTLHGKIETPAFITVGTKASVKSLSPEDLGKTGTQFVFANTYHLMISPGVDVIAKHGGIHKMSGIDKPIITDSGGFQVFSLARGNKGKNSSQDVGNKEFPNGQSPTLVKITNDGVEFRTHTDGQKHVLTPESSIAAQQKIGADFIVALDECIYYSASKKYIKRSVQRTHEWAKRSLAEHKKRKASMNNQRMYGVIQGGMYDDIHTASAKFVVSQPFWGIAIGGVAVGMTTKEIVNAARVCSDVLGDDPRPRHLLGIGQFEQILLSVKEGMDTFDCILPTRNARTGKLYIRTGEKKGIGIYKTIDITKSAWKKNLEKIDKNTLGNVTYAYLHHLFKERELLAYRLATIHNLTIMEKFFAEIRTAIGRGLL